ncbi:multidrug resistance protein A [Calothrix sp. NIES-4071]|nr:multidrug resistance protein A [Calothrix sp. NIES-4071]BAZ59340.1 multidrug resistance protein A [Calothrix sp. NIES-4105]
MESVNSSQQTHQVEPVDDSVNHVHEHETDDTSHVSAITPFEESIEESIQEGQRRRLARKRTLRRVILGLLLGAGVVASGVYFYRWFQFNKYHLTTDVAYTSADIYPVTSRVAGVVTEVSVKENQPVNPGTVLVKLDPREYQVDLAQAKAALDVAKQQVEVARESVNNVPPTIVAQPVNPSPTNPNQPKLVLPAPQTSNTQSEVNKQQYKAALATVVQRQAEVKQAELKLSYASIPALVPGQVRNSVVRVGQQIQPGQTLVEIVQPNPWIVANFQENQLERIQPGQKAEIKIAAFPSRKFKGTVESVSSSPTNVVASPSPNNTGSNFANMQSNNPRRIPVKIVFDPNSIKGFESKIAPNMSADVILSTRK